jgi:uncharacterized protein (DUF305 family)
MNKRWATGLVVAVVIVAGGMVIAQISDSINNHKADTATISSQAQANIPVLQKQFDGYTGKNYDKIFLASMIAHHQGAVQMAQMALTNANHQEVKDLASNIISTQNVEISEMQSWQKNLGYIKNESAIQAVVTQMQSEMDGMMRQLNGKAGDNLDKAFLAEMILHHQSAISMNRPAVANASQEEVKTVADNIITAQTKEA